MRQRLTQADQPYHGPWSTYQYLRREEKVSITKHVKYPDSNSVTAKAIRTHYGICDKFLRAQNR
jgi:hypothetical protein